MSDKALTVSEVIDLTEERFKQVAPSAISYEAEKGFAMQLLTNNDYLMKVAKGNPTSLAQAITNVAAIGLSLNPAEKLAYLIPRNMKEGNKWVSRIFLEPSYMGLCKLATNTGSIEWIHANCVYATDTFTDNGPGEKPTHTYNAFSKDRGAFVGVYCTAKTHTGDYLTTVMTEDEVNGIMERSEAVKSHRNNKGSGGPWISDFNEQAKKTVVRRGFKMWPRSDMNRMAEAVNLSNENEGFEPILTSPAIRDFTGEQKGFFDQMIENSDALGMYVFSESFDLNDATSAGAGVWTNLLHSFEKGTKGKYQRIVEDLRNKGESLFLDYVQQIEEWLGDDNDLVADCISEFDDETINLIAARINNEMAMEFGKVRSDNA